MRTLLGCLGFIVCGCAIQAADSSSEPVADLGTRKAGTDWPRFLGPAGTSVSTEKGIVPWPKQGPRVVWDRRLGTGYGSPTISRGRLFVFDRIENKARCTCVKAETGELLWKFEYPTEYVDSYGYANGARCCPVVDDDRVYLYGVEGMLYCLRVVDGKEVWKIDTKEEFHFRQNFFGVGSTPLIEGELLITQVGGSPKGMEEAPIGEVKGDGSGVVAFDKRTGKVKYRVTDELASYSTPTLATVNGKRKCFVFARGGLICLDPANGKVDFQFPWRAKVLESVNAASPVVVDDRVLISETYGPGAVLLKLKDGAPEEVWSDAEKGRKQSLQCHWNTPIYHDGSLYGCSGRHENNAELRCIDWLTGKVRWSERNLLRSTLLMVDGHFVCLSEDGALRLLKVNPDKFDLVSQCELTMKGAGGFDVPMLESPCWAAPVLSHGLMYLRGKDRLVCVELIPEK
jgi:outer membrane protein assembly factor BamB